MTIHRQTISGILVVVRVPDWLAEVGLENPVVIWVHPPAGDDLGLVAWTASAAEPEASTRDLDADLARLASETGFLVVLMTDDELADRGASAVVERGLRQGLTLVRRPLLHQAHVPEWLMNEIAQIGASNKVLFVDTSGHGRSAVAAVWALLARGIEPGVASEMVRLAAGPKALRSPVSHQRIADYVSFRSRIGPGGRRGVLPTTSLRRAHLPPPKAPWNFVVGFALTFDGYAPGEAGPDVIEAAWSRWLDFMSSGELDPSLTLVDARISLLETYRTWHWGEGQEPSVDEYRYMWALIEWIRTRIDRS